MVVATLSALKLIALALTVVGLPRTITRTILAVASLVSARIPKPLPTAITSPLLPATVTFNEAKVHKEVIEICKDKQKVVDKLSSCGVEYIPTTAKARREMLTQIMLKELENDK